MAILIDETKRVLVQGITGREGQARTRLMREYGTKVVGGVTPGKGGQSVAETFNRSSIARASIVFSFQQLEHPAELLQEGRDTRAVLRKKIGCRFMKKSFAALPLRTFPAIFKIRWPRTCTWHRCAFAINEFMQSCRVDDARSTFATKCFCRMGIRG